MPRDRAATSVGLDGAEPVDDPVEGTLLTSPLLDHMRHVQVPSAIWVLQLVQPSFSIEWRHCFEITSASKFIVLYVHTSTTLSANENEIALTNRKYSG